MTGLGLWLTVKDLSPCHFLTSDSIITFELNILFDCYYNDKRLISNILFYIFSIIIIFGCLVYNEILIINICKLDFNTRKEIIYRQSQDIINFNYELLNYNNNNNYDPSESINSTQNISDTSLNSDITNNNSYYSLI